MFKKTYFELCPASVAQRVEWWASASIKLVKDSSFHIDNEIVRLLLQFFKVITTLKGLL